jgi:glycosyltransferase involved in cell wall biosynthesis
MRPHVSIVLTSYNHARFLGEAIESVLAQTYANYTLIIADDGSTDSSWCIANSYRDPRIRLFRNERNQGGLLNQVLQSSLVTGPLVAIHHSDDAWEPDKLGQQVRILEENPNVAACFTNAAIIDSQSCIVASNPRKDPTLAAYLTIFDQPNRPRHEWLRRFACEGNCLCHPSVLIRKTCYDTLGVYDQRFFQLPDFHFWLRLCLQHEIYVLPNKLTRMRVHADGSNTSSYAVCSLVRKAFEDERVLEPLTLIDTVDFLLKIFPEASTFCPTDGEPVLQYLLARALLASRRRPVQSFALDIIYRLLENDDISQLLSLIHGFTFAHFRQLLETVDPRFIKQSLSDKQTISSLRGALTSARDRLFLNQHRISMLEKQIASIQRTTMFQIQSRIAQKFLTVVQTLQGITPLNSQIDEIKSSGLFDESYYLLRYRDVARAGLCPIRHYILHGAKEGRDPSALFDTHQYVRDHPEVATHLGTLNPLLHYLRSKRATLPS